MNSSTQISKVLLSSTLVSALLLAGCGSDNNNNSASTEVSQSLVTSTENYAPAQTEAETSVSQKISYKMPAIEGGQTTATAIVMIPKGKMPENGWPVIVWAHGTTGVADQCAPSVLKDAEGKFNLGGALPIAKGLVAQGYAVIAPDYEGLGSKGIHPFLNAKSASESIISALKAAKQQYGNQLSKDWAVVGHSQGGHAAIAAAERADGAGLNFKGVVAYAPASNLGTILLGGYAQVKSQLGQPAGVPTAKAVLPDLQAFASLISAGIMQYQPAFTYKTGFTSQRAIDIAAKAESECYPQVAAEFKADVSNFYDDSANVTKLYPGLDENFIQIPAAAIFLLDSTIGQKPVNKPIVVVQGELDSTVPAGITRLLESQVRASNKNNTTSITFKYQPTADHSSVVLDALNPTGQLAIFLNTNLPAK